MCKNKLIIAAAGSGKTKLLVENALRITSENVLITTYTQANEAEIRDRIIQINRYIPHNITIQTWFSFLLQHGVKPFQGALFEKDIKGMILVNNNSGIKYYFKGQPVYYSEQREFEPHYFTTDTRIYSDKISKFVFRCNESTNGDVIDRMTKIYNHIFIDELQDLSGYDLELLNLLFESRASILLVGDPRQATYSTTSSTKNRKYKKSKIINFFMNECPNVRKDTSTLTTNYRSIAAICDYSNRLFPKHTKTKSGNSNRTEHDGVFIIKEKDVNSYLKKFEPVQLRDSKRTSVHPDYRVMNFGESKGLSFERVLIYPTRPFISWMKDNKSELTDTSRSKIYVALTRARQSVAIVCDAENIDGTIYYSCN